MLKGIPSIISPELMTVLMEMGHGDEIVIADANFPAVSNARRIVRCDGHPAAKLLEAIMKFLPLDYAVEKPAAVMALNAGDPTPEVWQTYLQLIAEHETRVCDFDYVERFDFYERARKAFAIVTTGEQAYKANLLLKKGVYRES
ncbi:RbsD/FucU family protein [Paenibacillus montanisoli]|uniref:Fucose isomerase n=1 Tax=Paenibacillus montanisoli TaxID=2081970 RepID=A0A328U9L7_9BACL|nr:RbsD/FucU domain-containing protein [Paenibacillus montanisoli]RAP78543.1 fucose isomerase [Paenibacillus montanisoli]